MYRFRADSLSFKFPTGPRTRKLSKASACSICDKSGVAFIVNIMEVKTEGDDLPTAAPVIKDGPSIQIKVLFFAKARDITGLTELSLVVSSGSTTQDCLNKLVAKFPSLDEIRHCIVLALNEEYTTESAVVKDKDELAIIPPISGG
ncbi:hypothetical protein V6N13_062671 [Hibiscus sabdariffa]|uniref:Molybdopterin synthase sulfur carrier subunit n=1 Tax=Hibiscus sabdariffa TaxID=183260 RepID=A0ABR2BB49_9ROSI